VKGKFTEIKSSNLEGIHISEAVDRSVDYIKRRKEGEQLGLSTRWKKFNNIIGGGLEWGCQYCLAGISGGGKSSVANMLETDLFDLNPEQKFIVLNFNFEMPSRMQITRKFSSLGKMTVHKINSVESPLSDYEFDQILRWKEKLSNYNIFYFDVPGNVSQIKETVYEYQEKYPDYKILNILDHSRLITRDRERDEFEVVVNITKIGMELKKELECMNIFLSQLNGNIESEKRITNPSLHYPIRTDIYGNDAMYQSCDSVFIMHRPKVLGIGLYGTEEIETDDLVAFHILKNRNGEIGMIKMKDILKYNTIEEE